VLDYVLHGAAVDWTITREGFFFYFLFIFFFWSKSACSMLAICVTCSDNLMGYFVTFFFFSLLFSSTSQHISMCCLFL